MALDVVLRDPGAIHNIALDTAAGGPTYTITLNSGSYTLSGNAAAIRRGFLLTVVSGTYTLTGNTATLARGRTVSLVAGSYTVTGQATTLTVTRRIGLVSGSYALSGFQAAISQNAQLLASSGSYTLTGNAVGLRHNRLLTATSGTYALTGTATSLLRGYTIALASGSYTLSGQAAALTFGRTLALAVGSYVITGNTATLTYTPASSGTFKTATVNPSLVSGTHTDFPSYVDLARLGITTLAEAQSIRVYADAGKVTEWARQIVSATEMHVKVPSMTTTTTIYVDWDGVRADYAVTDTYGRNAVWSDYRAVYHLDDETDSTGNSYTLTNTNSVSFTSGKVGVSADTGVSNTNKTLFVNSYLGVASASAERTISYWLKPANFTSSPSNNPHYVSLWDGTLRRGNYMYAGGTGGQRMIFAQGGYGVNENNVASANNLSTSAWNYINYSYNGSTVRGRLNLDTAVTVASTGNTGVVIGSVFRLMAAYGNGVTTNFFSSGQIDEVRVRAGLLSADWETTEYNNQNDEASFWGTWADVGGGGGATLEAVSGSYAITGNAATLTVTRRIVLTSGSYTLTGQPADVLRGRTITLESGSYLITGNTASLRVSRVLGLSSGSYAISGFQAAISTDKQLLCSTGSYATTGHAATLRVTRTVSLGTGAYTITGQVVGLTYGRQVSLASGTYTFTGSDSSLQYNRTLTAESGTYSLSGNSATFTIPVCQAFISKEDGFVLLTEDDSLLITDQCFNVRSLDTTSGSYTITGYAAELTATRQITAAPGTYSITGSSASIGTLYMLSLDSGTYVLEGQSVALCYDGSIFTAKPRASSEWNGRTRTSTEWSPRNRATTTFTPRARATSTFTAKPRAASSWTAKQRADDTLSCR